MRKSAKSTLLRFKGDELTSGKLAAARQKIIDAFTSGLNLRLDISKIDSCGLEAGQLLCAAHRQAREQGLELSVFTGDSPVFGDFLQRSGLARIFGAPADSRVGR